MYKKISIVIIGVALLGVIMPKSVTVAKDINSTALTVSSKDIVKNTPNVIIYNSHADEAYSSGMKVTDVGEKIKNKLNDKSINSRFIKNSTIVEYVKSYEASRSLIKNEVKDYDKSVLLDIHRGVSSEAKKSTKYIDIVIVKSNPLYEENKKFIDSLINELNKKNAVEVNLVTYNKGIGYFNQDLSNKAAMIEIGNEKSTNSEIQECIDALVLALGNILEIK